MAKFAITPPAAEEVQKVVEDRLSALRTAPTVTQETITVEWRTGPLPIPVIVMPVDLLRYNPDTRRIRAQRSTNPELEKELIANPYGGSGQSYLHELLTGDPTDPSKVDPSFLALKEDLREHGQTDAGIITRAGVLINGNTRQAALRELRQKHIRVGVLPPDAGQDDLQAVELSLQLRKDHRRDYSFMNSLLAIEERAVAGHLPARIQADFRIKATTYDQRGWILNFVRSAIERSRSAPSVGSECSLRLVDFETHQGKLEELYRAYMTLKPKNSDAAEALKEQRLLALVLDKSKTDLRLIDADFVQRYMPSELSLSPASAAPPAKIPGTSISVPPPSATVAALRLLTTGVLRDKAITATISAHVPEAAAKANERIRRLDDNLGKGLDLAGKQGRVVKRRLAPVDRVSDACDDLNLAVAAVADARATGTFDAADLDDCIVTLKSHLEKFAAIVCRGADTSSDGIAWLREIAKLKAQAD
jgi:hypothetical protein